MIFNWNVSVFEGTDKKPSYEVIEGSRDFYVVFIRCSSWEEAERTRDEVSEMVRNGTVPAERIKRREKT